jgi:septum formation protein
MFFSADTVVFTHAQPITSDTAFSMLPDVNQELLEKPSSKEDNLRMLLDLNGGVCEVVTGLVVGADILLNYLNHCPYFIPSVYPILVAPGYTIKSVCCMPSSWLKLTLYR